MSKGGRWRGEKNRIKVVFRLQFEATQVPPSKGENLVITLIPVDVGKPTVRSEKASVSGDTCQWEKPLYETVKFAREPKTGKISEKIYHILVSATGFPKAVLLGEATIDFAGYAEAIKPSSLSLPLKSSEFEVLLHVTIQRTQDELRRRENGEPQKRTLLSQLSNSDQGDDGPENSLEINEFPHNGKSTRAGGVIQDVEFSPNLANSRSFDAVSVAWSDTSSGRYTPGDGTQRSSIHRQDSTSLLSPLGINETPQRPSFSPSDRGEDQRSNADELVVLARQVEMSDLEVQALRKQVVKERKLALELSKEVKTLTEERDKFKRDCDEMRSLRRDDGDGSEDEGERLRLMLEDVRNELEKEKAQNAQLCLQLKNMPEFRDDRRGSRIEEEIEDDDQYALEALIKEKAKESIMALSLEQKIAELNNEIEFHRKDREEMEMQMEQLALDYEIMKQENHEISSRLEQIQLREQLRMQYECSAHMSIISELEGQVEQLKADLERQAEAFDADQTALTSAKVEQEKKGIELGEALRKAKRKNVMMYEYLIEEIERLSGQMFAMFGKNEKLAVQALAEVSQLRLRNSHLEEALRKAGESAVEAEDRHRSHIDQLETEIALGKGHIERLYAKLREKTEELDKSRRFKAEQSISSLSEEVNMPKSRTESTENERNETRRQVKGRFQSGDYVGRLSGPIERVSRLPPNGDIRREVIRKETTSKKEETRAKEGPKPKSDKKDDKSGNGTLNKDSETRGLSALFEKYKERILTKQVDAETTVSSSQGNGDSSSEGCLNMEVADEASQSDCGNHLSPKPGVRSYTIGTNATEQEMMGSEIGIEEATTCSPQGQLTDRLCENTRLREMNKAMEEELREMRDRYSEISLKFAQVEGERQELVRTVRTMKNAMKS
ncbi:uncharacterized protein LOC144699996 [Wolffia australiana]